MSNWQPIETAPLDGTDVFIGWGKVSVPAWYCALPGEECWYEYNRGPADGKEEYGIESPTHWQPFPEAP